MESDREKNDNGHALAVVAPAAPEISAYEPRNFDEAMRLATVFASSRLLGQVQSPEAALLIMATGAELGISATAALRAIFVVEGKPFVSADLMVALCLKRTDICEYFVCISTTNEAATYETKRRGTPAPVRLTFTIADAKLAGLGVDNPKSNWVKRPAVMLRHRSSAELARQVYPDLVLGILCNEEEEDVRMGTVIDAMPIVTQPIVEREPENEPLEAAAERWLDLFAEAVRTQDREPAERARREIKARVPTSDPRYGALVKSYKEALSIIGRKAQPAKQISVKGADGEVISGPPDREPGSDDE